MKHPIKISARAKARKRNFFFDSNNIDWFKVRILPMDGPSYYVHYPKFIK